MAILNRGKLVAQGPVETLLKDGGNAVYTLNMKGDPDRVLAQVSAQPWVAGIHTRFYLSLTLTMGAATSNRAAVLAVTLGVVLGGMILPMLLPEGARNLLVFTPWLLPNLAPLVAAGAPLPWTSMMVAPVVATAVWSPIFMLVAIWKFQRVEL